VAKVNSTAFPPGAHVLFQRGGEWHESLVVPSSGTAGAPVVFASYGSGMKPRFWGSDPIGPASFQPVEGTDSTYRMVPSTGTTVNSIQANHAFFRSAYLVANRTADPTVALSVLEAVPGTWYQDPRSGELYVHTMGDDPRSGSVLYTASTRQNVVYVHLQHDVVIRNLVVDEAAIYNSGYAFGVGESANVTIEGCEAYRAAKHHFGAIDTDNFVGRSLYSAWAMPDQGYGGASAYVSYSDSQHPDSRSAWYDCVYDELDSAVSPYLAFLTHGPGLGEVLVQNMVSRGGLGISVSLDGPDSRIHFQGGVIENGYLAIWGNNSVVDGMTLRGPTAAVVLTGFNNVVQNVLIDGAKPDVGDLGALVDHGQDNTLRFNTVRLDPATAIGVGVVVDARLVGTGGARTRVYGNIIDAARAFRVDTDRAWPITSDHNLFARTPFFMNPNGDAMDLAQWQVVRGQDVDSIVGDPLFADPALGDYSLLPGSPAIDAFTPTELLAGIPIDLLGLPRPQGAGYDLGAFERPAAIIT
jgi:hypothetical protein